MSLERQSRTPQPTIVALHRYVTGLDESRVDTSAAPYSRDIGLGRMGVLV